MKNKNKNYLIRFFTAFILLVYLVVFPGSVFAVGLSVPVADINSGLMVDSISGAATNAAMNTALEAAATANQVCETSEQAYFKADTAATFALGGLSLIAGGAALMAKLQAKITAIEGFIVCRQAVLTAISAVKPVNVFIANQKQTFYSSVTASIKSLQNRIEPLKNQQIIAQDGFWKTLVFNVLIKTTQSVSTRLLAKLNQSYAIRNFKKYADAVATQVYDNQYIVENYKGDHVSQAIIRSMMSNPLAQSRIQPSIFRVADTALGFDPKALTYDDPSYFSKMAQVGFGSTNPFLIQMNYASEAERMHGAALAQAHMEIAQSQGLKTPRTCVESLSQQKRMELSVKSAEDQLANRQSLYNDLQNAKSIGLPVKNEDLEKAKKDLDVAKNTMDKTPKVVSGSNGADFALSMCEAIVSPPALIDKGINMALESIGKNLGTYNNNNLPFFINAITDVANQVSTSLIFGGKLPSGTQLLSENVGTLGAAAGYGLAAATSGSLSGNLEKGILFNYYQNSEDSEGYTLEWEVMPTLGDAKYVKISASGQTPSLSQLPISGSSKVNPKVMTTYTLSIYDVRNRLLATAPVIITPPSPAQVKGAFTSKPSFTIRGNGNGNIHERLR